MSSPINSPGDNEFALASIFSNRCGNDLRYTAAWGRWSIWNGQYWVKDETLYVHHLVRTICDEAAVNTGNPQIRSRIASARTVDAVERLARADRRHVATVDQWDSDPWLLNTPGGIVDLHTAVIRPARREDYATKITAVAPGGECPLWTTFLPRITNSNKEQQDYIQCMCGYALTGKTNEQDLHFLYGTGANGKSTFLETIAGLMGGYAKTAPIETFMASFGDRHLTEIAWLQGARLVISAEPDEGKQWNESRIKQLTGGDRNVARYMRQDPFEYVPQFKLVIAGNHKPGLRSVDEAMRRRFRLLPFTVTIPESERDRGLADKLLAEWPGILQWAIDGCLLWQSKGLQMPDTVRDATANYFEDEDVVSQWIEDRCETKESYSTPFTELYKNWEAWCRDNGEDWGTWKRFSVQLQSHGFQRDRRRVEKKLRRRFNGIGLKGQV